MRSNAGCALAMAADIHFAPETEQDLDEAYAWYEERRVGLGEEFISCVDACIQAIARMPQIHARVHREYRRMLVRRFSLRRHLRTSRERGDASIAFFTRPVARNHGNDACRDSACHERSPVSPFRRSPRQGPMQYKKGRLSLKIILTRHRAANRHEVHASAGRRRTSGRQVRRSGGE